jgi:hypothetical protein
LVRVDVVHYLDDASPHRDPVCRLWVDRSGRVLKQESLLLGSKLMFVRRSDQVAADLIDSARSPSEGEPRPSEASTVPSATLEEVAR